MEATWQWAAYGKHPVAKDFFRLGQIGLLVKDFSRWVDKGYQLFATRKRISLNSWRFWTRGVKKNGLGCGVVRDCRDQLARPYPLLIMGVGTLDGWEDQWDLNPLACERTWTQMEYLYTRNFSSLNQLEGEIQRIPPPLSQWPEFREAQRKGLQEAEMDLSPISQKAEIFFPLDQLFPDPSAGINYLHSFLKKEQGDIPQSIFMGGTLEKAHIAVFRRPLIPTDFVQLWSGPPTGGS